MNPPPMLVQNGRVVVVAAADLALVLTLVVMDVHLEEEEIIIEL